MSNISPKMQSVLPEDIEQLIRDAQNHISNLRTEMDKLERELKEKKRISQQEMERMDTDNKNHLIEQSKITSSIESLKEEKVDIQDKITQETVKLNSVVEECKRKSVDLVNLNQQIESKEGEFKERELHLGEKESALNVYANALSVKEQQINKYLQVFDSMKSVIK